MSHTDSPSSSAQASPEYVIRFFGQAWDSPIFDDGAGEQVPTPVGDQCLYCHESIMDGDRGFIRPVATVDNTGNPHAALSPIHVECDLRSVLGSVAHLERRCFCVGVDNEIDYPGTVREEALEVLVRVNQLRATQGMGPLWEQTA
jgi:hypothetical protein